ncbi:GNAT family N-acetyltransferase [Aquimarina brevivitae]|uniref:GNAT family N-acetyltransferase n=1 Tax=Aquimarina brevivitae TaxID=323412 RepID=UPI001029AB36|nr:GNAT family N-acetyltransferase [Aquimarina brevivitae]
MIIRPAKQEDIEGIVTLCKQHAHYEKTPYQTKYKTTMLAKALFTKTPAVECLVLELNNTLMGYSTFMKQFSTWEADYYLYLDCLFLDQKVRGFGYGSMLFERIIEEAKNKDCKMIQWQTPVFNELAINFYKSKGAWYKSKERFFHNVCQD